MTVPGPTAPDPTRPNPIRPDVPCRYADIRSRTVYPRPPCPLGHSMKRDGGWVPGDDESLGAIYTSNGRTQYKMRCNHCGETSGALPNSVLDAWHIDLVFDLAWSREHEPSIYEPCSVRDCTAGVTEYHHFAPYNTFGTEADLWPVMPLCRDHHVRWHQMMDGYRWHRARVSA